MPKTVSPLRYPGGKTKFIPLIAPYITNYKTFAEPFAGGAGVSLNFLMTDTVENIILNDYDIGIYSFWKAILEDTDVFIDKMKNIEISPDEWKRQRNKYLSATSYSVDNGLSAFYLNRVCRSGILTAGIIGGNNQTGTYKMDCRFNKPLLEKQIRKIASYKNRIHVNNDDVNTFLKNINSDVFLYLDPPYYYKGKALYHKYFTENGHEQLKSTLETYVNNPWIMTYDNAPEIKELYKNYKIQEFELNYSVNSKRKETELMIFNHNIP